MNTHPIRRCASRWVGALLVFCLLSASILPAADAVGKDLTQKTAVGVSFPVYQIGKAVTLRWASVKDATRYQYTIRDLSAAKDVKSVTVRTAKGVLPAKLADHNATYKVTIVARNDKGKSLGTIIGYFHVGKMTVRPTGKYTPDAFESTGTRVAAQTSASPKPQKSSTPAPIVTASPKPQKSSTPAPTATASPKPSNSATPAATTPLPMPADAPAFMGNNLYFVGKSGDTDDHWVNAGLNDTFWNDVYKLSNNENLGFIDIDPIMERDVFNALNAYRKKHGLNELIWNDSMCRMARARSMGHILQSGSLQKRYSHDIEDLGGQFEDSVKRWGLRPVTSATRENIAWFAHETNKRPDFYASEVIQAWIDSLDHEQNMRRSGTYGAIGVVWSYNMYMGGYVGMDVVMVIVE